MGVKRIQEELTKDYADMIREIRIDHVNEIYVEAGLDHFKELCVQLNQSMGMALVAMFGCDYRMEKGYYTVNCTFADRSVGVLVTVILEVNPDKPEYPSITDRVHAAALYEREIKDMFGLEPVGHPDAKPLLLHGNWPEGNHPLRKDFETNVRLPFADREIPFKKVGGEGVFEIPVGPVHAGIIEPGHFRFSVAGEPIINLEAQLGYVHKGLEKLAEGATIEKGLFIAERISGDETFANSLAYCLAVEKLAGVIVPKKAKYNRVVFAELERLTAHLGDLAGICLDVAYGFGCFQFRMMRGWAYLIAEELCGSRFLRGVNRPGGVRKDFIEGKEKSILPQLRKIDRELTDTWKILRGNSMFADRVENTGAVKLETIRDLNGVGPAGRAAGAGNDVRKNFPYCVYAELHFNVPVYADGDVNARMKVKLKEAHESISLMIRAFETAHGDSVLEPLGDLVPYRSAYGMTESPRGENIHYLVAGEGNRIFRYKVRTPSFCNWPIVCHAVQGNIVPDFPLINKSFNLSYAGNDL